MATVKVIRKRIASVKNTQKITKAMKMVSAAKLRRAQNRLIQSRPYAQSLHRIISHLVHLTEKAPHPIFVPHKNEFGEDEVKKINFLILTSDRGLCGGFNGNLLRRVEAFIAEKTTSLQSVPDAKVSLSVVGRKGRDYFRARKREPDEIVPTTDIGETVPFETIFGMTQTLIEDYQSRKFDEYYVVYNYFRSAISQEVKIERILPWIPESVSEEADGNTMDDSTLKSGTYLPEYVYEPSKEELLQTLIPKALATRLRQAFLESIAGEYAARMVAMDNATNNSADMIQALTLQMNRLRQAAITKELMDIVNGAESLK